MSNARELAEVGGSYGQGGFVGMKNRIINGAMMIDQRNSGSAITTSSSYPVDRFAYSFGAGAFSAQRVTDAPAGFANSTKISCTSTATTDVIFEQKIEGNNMQDFAYGTASASATTLSFWVKSNVTGQYSIFVYRPDAGRSCILGYTISSANTWEYKTVAIPADTTTATTATNGEGLRFDFFLSTSATTGAASTWKTLDSQRGITGQVNIGSSTSNTWYITGVQLEKGSTATSFDYRPYGTELALCQRYYWKTYNIDVAPGTIASEGSISFPSTGGLNRPVVATKFAVTMRANPTITTYSPNTGTSGKCRNDNAGTDQNTGSGQTGFNGTVWYPSVSTTLSDSFSAQVVASAEL